MNTTEIANKLDGIEYPPRVPKDIEAAAKTAGVVIAYGCSDDLVELHGAIREELDAYNGVAFMVTHQGLFPNVDRLIENYRGPDLVNALRNYFAMEGYEVEIEALWGAEPDISWTFKTTIPHETFNIMEDGAVFCRGIVFRLEDVKP